MNSLIIENSQRQGILRRLSQGSITLVFWALWIYLLLPLFEPLMAMAGVELPTIGIAGPEMSIEIFLAVLLLIGAAIVSFRLWAGYNTLLHRRTQRQDPLSIVCRNELANYFSVCPAELAGWHRSGQLTIELTEQGGIYCVAT